MKNNFIIIKGAKEHNLKNVDLKIPKNKFIVFTGLSGSGKSSLAFNTIYAEGRRRYVESLSAYARQFLGTAPKANVEYIEGLTPAIAIEQKSTNNNPRSTVGTTTEIFDYLRLLYARIGKIMCINGHGLIQTVSIDNIINNIKKDTKINDRIYIMSPLIENSKGSHMDLFDKLKNDGFLRINVNGQIIGLNSKIELDKNKKHNIDLIIDRLIFASDKDTESRIFESVENAIKYGNGVVKIWNDNLKKEFLFSKNASCIKCSFSLGKLEPKLFSFNSPSGACKNCNGIGMCLEVDIDLLIPNKNFSIFEGGIKFLQSGMESQSIDWKKFMILINHYKIPPTLPIKNLTNEQLDIILNGSKEPIKYKLNLNNIMIDKIEYIEGIAKLINRRYFETKSDRQREVYRSYLTNNVCFSCKGHRLSNNSLTVKINNTDIISFCKLSLNESLKFMNNLKLNKKEQQIAKLIIDEINNRLSFLVSVGLNYLSLSRNTHSLSGGELQRIRLATQIGSKLSGVLYVLDEPSIGLHQSDNDKLINTLKNLRDIDNTVIVVEHDEDTIKSADWLVDIGPNAGTYGGKIVYNGKPEGILNIKNSLTGDYLSRKKTILIPKTRRKGNGKFLNIIEASENNLKNISVKIPLNKFVVITGVSGSGKSTLINDIIYNYIYNNFNYVNTKKPGKVKEILGLENIDKIIQITQSPIGRTPRSNPATYTSVFDDIRDLFANVHESKVRGYQKGRFSFNVTGGRCEKCFGDGYLKIQMHFLPDVYVKCEDCKGKKYNKETLGIRFKTKNIAEVLNLTVDEAYIFFDKQIKIKEKLKIMKNVGLGYVKLGQPAPELSGGEAQRVKLAAHLQKRATGKTLFLLDEPTTGLHIHDVNKLLNSLNTIVDNGDSIIVIEHNLDLIKSADYIIDLGPQGGKFGGKIVAIGTPEEVSENSKSLTGKYLKKILYN